MSAEWVVGGAGLTLSLGVWAGRLHRRARPGDGQAPPPQVRRVRIRGAYEPAEVHVCAGAPCRLIFRREETAPCSERVVFPDFGISVMLPPYEDVPVDLPPGAPGVHEFTCQMRMLHGTLVVDDPPRTTAPTPG